MSRNTLWTYVLPSLPAAAASVALWLTMDSRHHRVNIIIGSGLLTMSFSFTVAVLGFPEMHSSAKDVIAAYEARREPDDEIIFIGPGNYSAAFYSRGEARIVKINQKNAEHEQQILEQLETMHSTTGSQFLALQKSQMKRWASKVYERAKDEGIHGNHKLLRLLWHEGP